VTSCAGFAATYRLRLAARPGVWMLPCHTLLHAAMGMSTDVVCAGISTPFGMGAGSGNAPE
jgi:hypothetical protein